MNADEHIQAFHAIFRLAGRMGIVLCDGPLSPIWATNLGPWEIWANPRSKPYRLNGSVIPPKTAYVMYMNAPVGLFHEHGGAFAPFGRSTLEGLLRILEVATSLITSGVVIDAQGRMIPRPPVRPHG